MKIIKDERLQMKNLKNLRVAFIVQTIGIIAILVYEMIVDGITAATNNPLWLVFMTTMVVLGWLNLTISVDMYDDANKKKMPFPYYVIVIISALIGVFFGVLAKIGPDSSTTNGAIIVGGVVFVCFLATFSFGYFLRKKRLEDHDGS